MVSGLGFTHSADRQGPWLPASALSAAVAPVPYIYISVFSPLKVRWGAGEGNVLGCCTKNLRLARCNEVYDVCLKVLQPTVAAVRGRLHLSSHPHADEFSGREVLQPHTLFSSQPDSVSNLNFALRPQLGPPAVAQESSFLQPCLLSTLPGAAPVQPHPSGYLIHPEPWVYVVL